MASYNEKRRIIKLDNMRRTGGTTQENDFTDDSIDLLIVNQDRARKWYMAVDHDKSSETYTYYDELHPEGATATTPGDVYDQGTKRIPMDRIAFLNESRLIPSNFLPSYIDEVIQGHMTTKFADTEIPEYVVDESGNYVYRTDATGNYIYAKDSNDNYIPETYLNRTYALITDDSGHVSKVLSTATGDVILSGNIAFDDEVFGTEYIYETGADGQVINPVNRSDSKEPIIYETMSNMYYSYELQYNEATNTYVVQKVIDQLGNVVGTEDRTHDYIYTIDSQGNQVKQRKKIKRRIKLKTPKTDSAGKTVYTTKVVEWRFKSDEMIHPIIDDSGVYHEYREYVAPWDDKATHPMYEFPPTTDKIYVDIYHALVSGDTETMHEPTRTYNDYYQFRYLKASTTAEGVSLLDDKFVQIPNVMILEDGQGTVKHMWGDGSDNRIFQVNLNLAPDHEPTTDSSSVPELTDAGNPFLRMIGVDPSASTDRHWKLYHFTTGIREKRINSVKDASMSDTSAYIVPLTQQEILPQWKTATRTDAINPGTGPGTGAGTGDYIKQTMLTTANRYDYAALEKTSLGTKDTVNMDFGTHFWIPRLEVNKSGHIMDIDLWDMVLPNTAARTTKNNDKNPPVDSSYIHYRGLVEIGGDSTHLSSKTDPGTTDITTATSFIKVAAWDHTHGASTVWFSNEDDPAGDGRTYQDRTYSSVSDTIPYKPYDNDDVIISSTDLLTHLLGLTGNRKHSACILNTYGNIAEKDTLVLIKNNSDNAGKGAVTINNADTIRAASESTIVLEPNSNSIRPQIVYGLTAANNKVTDAVVSHAASNSWSSTVTHTYGISDISNSGTDVDSLFNVSRVITGTNKPVEFVIGTLNATETILSLTIPISGEPYSFSADASTVRGEKLKLPSAAYSTNNSSSSRDILTVNTDGRLTWRTFKEWLGITPTSLLIPNATAPDTNTHGIAYTINDAPDVDDNVKFIVSSKVFISNDAPVLGIKDDTNTTLSLLVKGTETAATRSVNIETTLSDNSFTLASTTRKGNGTPSQACTLKHVFGTAIPCSTTLTLGTTENKEVSEVFATFNSKFTITKIASGDANTSVTLQIPDTTLPVTNHVLAAKTVSYSYDTDMEWFKVNDLTYPAYGKIMAQDSTKYNTVIGDPISLPSYTDSNEFDAVADGCIVLQAGKAYHVDASFTTKLSGHVTPGGEPNDVRYPVILTGTVDYTLTGSGPIATMPFSIDLTHSTQLVNAGFVIPKLTINRARLTLRLSLDSKSRDYVNQNGVKIKYKLNMLDICQIV